jgi:hypothetical protein
MYKLARAIQHPIYVASKGVFPLLRFRRHGVLLLIFKAGTEKNN